MVLFDDQNRSIFKTVKFRRKSYQVSFAKWGLLLKERICSESSPYDKGGNYILC